MSDIMTYTEKYGYLVDYFAVRDQYPPGTVLRTVVRHVSSSGMTRYIDVYGPDYDYMTHLVGNVIGWPVNATRHNGITVTGCGMDMGFHTVYTFGRVIWRDGFDTAGYWKRAGGSRGDDRKYRRNEELDHDPDGGYAYVQRWL